MARHQQTNAEKNDVVTSSGSREDDHDERQDLGPARDRN